MCAPVLSLKSKGSVGECSAFFLLECKIPCHLIKYAKKVIIFMTDLHVLYILHGKDYVEGTQ